MVVTPVPPDADESRTQLDAGDGSTVTAAVHEPGGRPRGAFALTHGAGNDLTSRGLVAFAGGVAAAGHVAVRFNLPYRERGRRSPPAAERSVDGYRAAFDDAKATIGPRLAWAAGGKSYGGRVASLAVADGMAADALVFYGYPLHPPGAPERLRVDHWPAIDVPCLFLEGTSDPFCDLDLLREHLPRLKGDATLHVVDGGDHSLRVRRGEGRPARGEVDVLAELAAVAASWFDERVGGRRR